MHDIHAANQILKLALKYAKKNKLKKLNKIKIELGFVVEHGLELLPENLKFNVKMLAKGTIAKNAKMIIKKSGKSGLRLLEIEGD